MLIRIISSMVIAIVLSTIQANAQPASVDSKNNAKRTSTRMEFSSSAFSSGQTIPKKYTADGANVSPPLKWSSIEGAKSFAVICNDPDAPVGDWIHWVIFNIPPNSLGLYEGVKPEKHVPNGARQGTNSFHKIGYGGPSPPAGKPHRYFFTVYALKDLLNLDPGSTADEVKGAMQGHIIAQEQYMGTYGR